MTTWTKEEIDVARSVSLIAVISHLGIYYKFDNSYKAQDPKRKSIRVLLNYLGQDLRFIFTGEKWLHELVHTGIPNRGGGGAIDFVSYLTGLRFVQAVRVCLDAESGHKERALHVSR